MEKPKVALISVFDKTGIVQFAKRLQALRWQIISSGGTAKVLRDAGLTIREVSEISGLKAALDHRVVTLVPQIHGGLLALPKHLNELEVLGWPWIDLVCVDLYPMQEAIARPDATLESVRELTDIGGPTMIRSAIKGDRIVIADPPDRTKVLKWLAEGMPDDQNVRRALAAKAEGIIANYCLASARFQSWGRIDGVIGSELWMCKYGENGWQTPARVFSVNNNDPLGIQNFKLVGGAEQSFNGAHGFEALIQSITHVAAGFKKNLGGVPFIAIGAKHNNPCGASVATRSVKALQRMIVGDRLALHGGLVMTNFKIGMREAKCLLSYRSLNGKKRLLDGIFAPAFSRMAIDHLARKHGKCRLFQNPALATLDIDSLDKSPRVDYVRGGFTIQPNYTYVLDLATVGRYGVWSEKPTLDEMTDLILAWAIGSTSTSNTITIVKDGKLLGNGVGQQDRVGAAELVIRRARRSKHKLYGATAYSDSFFPFADGPLVLAKAGIRQILATSGSVNDGVVELTCKENGVVLLLVPDGMGRGFYGH